MLYTSKSIVCLVIGSQSLPCTGFYLHGLMERAVMPHKGTTYAKQAVEAHA